MKATTVAAAAALLGSVNADGWEGWSSTPEADTTTPVKVTQTTPEAESSTTWSAWSTSETPVKDTTTSTTTWSARPTSETPVKDTTTSTSTWSAWTTSETPVKDTTTGTSTWSAWTSTTSKTPVEASSKTSSESTWSEWSTASTPVQATSTTTEGNTWGEWSSTSTPVKATSTTPEENTWSEWSTSSTPVAASTKTTSESWSEWSTTSKPAVAASTASETWSNWEPTETITSTSTQWITVTVYPASEGQTWSEWSTPVALTTTNSKTVLVSSTVTMTASSEWTAWSTPVAASSTPAAASWPAPAAASANGNCQMEVSLSYGPPVWYPTPVIAASVNSTTWSNWESATSSTPVAQVTTSSETWAAWSSSTPAAEVATSSGSWAAWSSSTPAAEVATSSGSWAAWSSSTPAAQVSTSSETWAAWSSTSSTPAKVTTTTAGTTWSAWSQSQGSASSQTGSATGSASWSQSTSGISANGNKFGMTYSPYTASGECKDAATVAADIAKIAKLGFTSVRVYSTDCSTLENVGSAAQSNNLKIILGVFISSTGISGAQPQVEAIAKWAKWELVELIIVGNEAVFQGQCSASDLAGFISSAKQTFKKAGFNGAVSTTDELSVWQSQGSAWCDVVDVVTANLYAFFNPDTTADAAGSFIQSEIEQLSKICPGKDVYVMESGWPSAGQCNGAACPSPENQATAIKGIQQAVGAKVVFFSFEDELWKQPGQFGVEQHWGCANVFSGEWSSW